MEFKKEALYAKSHEWVIFDGDEAIIGISDYAQSELGDLVFVNLPEVDDEVEVGEAFADVESVKADHEEGKVTIKTKGEVDIQQIKNAIEKLN